MKGGGRAELTEYKNNMKWREKGIENQIKKNKMKTKKYEKELRLSVRAQTMCMFV